MRRSIRLFLTLSVVVLCCHLHVSGQQRKSTKQLLSELLYYWNSNLLTLDKINSKKLESLASQLVPNRKNPETKSGYKPWLPWFVFGVDKPDGHSVYVLLEAHPLMTIPGESFARIHLFDNDGKHLGTTEFPTGWRIHLKDARFLPRNLTGYPMIEISVEHTSVWDGLAREYYALKGTTVTLVRLETAEGEIRRNNYSGPVPSIGTPVPVRSEDEWKAALTSGDVVEVLQTLLWLGGKHSEPDSNDADPQSGPLSWLKIPVEKQTDAKLVSAVRARKDVRKLIEGLTKSTNRWIREAAELALKPATDDD